MNTLQSICLQQLEWSWENNTHCCVSLFKPSYGSSIYSELWTLSCQAALCMEFSRQEYWNHSLLQGIFLTQGSNLGLLHCRQIVIWATREALIMATEP